MNISAVVGSTTAPKSRISACIANSFSILFALSLCSSAAAEEWNSSITLQAGFVPDPYSISVSAGGSMDAINYSANCSGFINPDAPSLVFDYQSLDQPTNLGFFVDSMIDTTLTVIAPDGSITCNDDSEFLANANPGLEIANAPSGQYRVMVGSYAKSDAGEPATLVVTEYGPAMWLVLDLDAGFDSLLVNMVTSDIDFGDDSGDWANDGECDDPRFIGQGSAMMPSFDHEGRDASDCRVLFGLGEVRLARPAQPQ